MNRLTYGNSFPMSEEAQRDDFVIPVILYPEHKDPQTSPTNTSYNSSAKPKSNALAKI